MGCWRIIWCSLTNLFLITLPYPGGSQRDNTWNLKVFPSQKTSHFIVVKCKTLFEGLGTILVFICGHKSIDLLVRSSSWRLTLANCHPFSCINNSSFGCFEFEPNPEACHQKTCLSSAPAHCLMNIADSVLIWLPMPSSCKPDQFVTSLSASRLLIVITIL
jgi:hypothetical protein